jgi:hypothetical protein
MEGLYFWSYTAVYGTFFYNLKECSQCVTSEYHHLSLLKNSTVYLWMFFYCVPFKENIAGCERPTSSLEPVIAVVMICIWLWYSRIAVLACYFTPYNFDTSLSGYNFVGRMANIISVLVLHFYVPRIFVRFVVTLVIMQYIRSEALICLDQKMRSYALFFIFLKHSPSWYNVICYFTPHNFDTGLSGYIDEEITSLWTVCLTSTVCNIFLIILMRALWTGLSNYKN